MIYFRLIVISVHACSHKNYTLPPSSGGKKQNRMASSETHCMHMSSDISCILNKHTSLEAALRLGDISQARVRGAL